MKATKKLKGLALLFFSLVLVGILGLARIGAEDQSTLKEPVGEGWIDWTKGMIYARGEAALNAKETSRALARVQAERAATVIAQRNLLEIVKGVRVESETTVENFVLKSDRIKATVNGLVRGASTVKVEEDPSGSVKVTVGAPLWGDFAKALLGEILPPQSSRRENFFSRISSWSHLGRMVSTLVAWFGGTRAQAAIAPNSGLVIDVSDTEIKPGVFPRIYDQDGKLILGPNSENQQVAASMGLVGYASSVQAAVKDDLKRVGVLPLVTRGTVPVGHRGGIDIMVKDLSLNKLKSALQDPSILRECRVTVAYKVTF
ncbi:MAG: hypothetical protein NT009_12330 [Proteobacteria bacterium]|nr:hypothetical protein [Pseudomonadota bacterium]